MITIEHPFIEKRGDETFLCANISDESRGGYFVWFSVVNEYAEYLVEDRADAFLLLVYMIAMRSGQDILVKAPVSHRLLFNLENTIQPLFSWIIPNGKKVEITAPDDCPEVLGSTAVGCGCSLGVDSMSSFLKHYGPEVIKGYEVTHLAIFNSCQFGYVDLESAEQKFRKAVDGLKPFSSEVGKPIVAVNTNLNELYLGSGFTTASSRFIPSTLSCVLALQKLFGKYIFSSSYSVANFAISQIDHSHAEAAFVPLMSTESTEIILSNPCMTRVEKTDFISKHPLTQKYLDVCWAEQQAFGVAKITKWVEGKTKRNCGWCDKCLRTLFTFELLGVDIKQYEDGFDLDKYHAHKEGFIKNVVLGHRNNVMYEEIYALMREKNFHLPWKIKLLQLIDGRLLRLMIKIKSKVC